MPDGTLGATMTETTSRAAPAPRGSFTPGTGPMRAEHERILGWLRRGHDAPRAHRPEAIDRDAYSPAARAAAVRVWSRRMHNEHGSAAVFARLLPELMACGASLDHCTTVTRCAADELHHGALCADVVRALGAEPPSLAGVETQSLPEHADVNRLEGTLRNVVFVGCLAETVAVAFTAEERELTTDPYVRCVITQISADEVLHARFGWSLLAEVAPTLDGAARDRFVDYLRTAFFYLEREELLEVPNVQGPRALVEQAQALGVCDNPRTRELFYETVHEVIVPGLEGAGIAASRAWEERRAP